MPWTCSARTKEAGRLYIDLTRRGLKELNEPDDDANECWEDADWTRGVVVDCIFRTAGCLAKIGKRADAVEWYNRFLGLLDFRNAGHLLPLARGVQSKKLPLRKKAVPDVMERMKRLEAVMG